MVVLRALYDFAAAQHNEMALRSGDLLLLLHSINDDWLHVRHHTDVGQTNGRTDGDVPSNYVRWLAADTEKLFAATERFQTGVAGDLAFDKGELVIGTAPIDENWWHGRLENGATGIFPLTHVAALTVSAPAPCNNSDNGHTMVRATMDLTAQLDDELSFNAGDVIEVLYMIDEDFGVGRCGDREGSFPAAFVKPIKGSLSNGTAVESEVVAGGSEVGAARLDVSAAGLELGDAGSEVSAAAAAESEDVGSEVTSLSGVECYARALYAFSPENDNELALTPGDFVMVIRQLDGGQWLEGVSGDQRGIFPASYVDMSANPALSEIGATVLYGRVLYDFAAETPAELTVHVGDTVTVIGHPHTEWLLVKHDDERVGLCPVNYVDLFPCDSPSETDTDATSIGTHPKENSDAIVPESTTFMVREDNTEKQVSKRLTRSDESATCGSAETPGATVRPTVKPKPAIRPKPKSVNRSLTAQMQNLGGDLDNLIKAQMMEAQGVPSSGSKSESTMKASWSIPPPPDTQQVGQSTFFTGVTKRAPPPRPTGPRPAPAPSRTILEPQKSSTPIPQRAAPPRPDYTPPPFKPKPAARKAQKRSDTDLIAFSPETASAESLVSQEQMDVVDDLHRRIATIEKDLENCNNSRIELEARLAADGITEAESVDMRETLEFYMANINGLTSELQLLKGNLSTMQPEAAEYAREVVRRQKELDQQKRDEERRRAEEEEDTRRCAEKKIKMRENRRAVIAELIKTEEEYHASICFFLEAVQETDRSAVVEIDTLVYNMDQIAELSEALLFALKDATEGRDFEEQKIGEVLVQCAEDLKKLYSPYCCNHEKSLTLLDKYESDSEAQSYFADVMDGMRRRNMDSFDFGSMLIKPVQRVLKYPLLITQLLKMTEDSHPDKQYLRTAVKQLTDVATAINEQKRGLDLVQKYRKDTDSKLSERVSVRATKKKIWRYVQKFVGVQTVDANFDIEERKFNNIESAVRMFVRDLCPYLEKMKVCVGSAESVANDLADYCAEHQDQQREIDLLCQASGKIANAAYGEFREQVDQHVLRPLKRLLLLCSGPQKVASKRKDKLLDYDRLKGLPDTEPANPSEEFQIKQMKAAKADYEALNSQLLDELPRFSALAQDIFSTALGRLIAEQSKFYGRARSLVAGLVEHLLVTNGDNTVGSIVETFLVTHAHAVARIAEISFVPAHFDPRFVDEKKQVKSRRSMDVSAISSVDCHTQSDSQRLYLRQLYSSDQLYVVGEDITAAPGALELAPPSGTLVGVVKQSDPMGNKLRWFVDTGDTKGFIMRKYLTPATAAPPSDSDVSTPVDFLGSKTEVDDFEWTSSQRSTWYGLPASPADNDGCPSVHWFDGQTDDAEVDTQGATPMGDDDEFPGDYYQAVYTYDACSDIEISLQGGAIVKVIDKHDLDGNIEWWLVETEDGCRGYFPASHLYSAQ